MLERGAGVSGTKKRARLALRGLREHVKPFDFDRPIGGAHQAGNHVHYGCLSGAVQSQEAYDFAGPHFKGEVVNRP